MAKPISLLMWAAACVAALVVIGTVATQAKQPCSVAPVSGHGFWSWRIIDGRKCWYEGKPMLSKSMLEWPSPAKTAPDFEGELSRVPAGKEADPLDAQAYAPNDSATFETLWRDRIEKR